MNTNWNLPVLTSNYAAFLAEMKSRDEDIATWFDDTTSENLPNKTKRWNSSGSKFEIWDGTAWSDLSNLYEIKARDSDKLNGQIASYYAVANHGHTAATTTANGFMSSADKTKLNEIEASANNYSHPTGDGNLHVPANGTSNNGKFLQATGVAGSYVWANVPATSLSTLGITATAAELNILDGCLITVAQLNYLSALSGNVQVQLNEKAALASPALTGTPTAPTPTAGDNSTKIATSAFVMGAISAPFVFTAGSRLEAFASGGTYKSSSFMKVSEIQVAGTGTVTTSMTVATAAGSSTAYGRIYKNGVAVGTVRSVASGSTTFTENINVAAGDLIQAYGYGANMNTENIFSISNLKIYVAQATSSNPTTNS